MHINAHSPKALGISSHQFNTISQIWFDIISKERPPPQQESHPEMPQAPWPPAKWQVSSQFPWQLNNCSQKQNHMKLSGNLYIMSFWMWASNLLEMQAPRWKVSPPFKFDPSYHPTGRQSGKLRIFQMLSILPDWWMQGRNKVRCESNWPKESMKPTFQKIYNCLCILSKADAESNVN